MLSVSALAAGQGDYYVTLAQSDYYTRGGEPPGRWVGSGAKAVGLEGVIDEREFLNLFRGLRPDGTPGVQWQNGRDHQPAWDLSFSAPKSVSTAWGIADRDSRREIEAAHNAACQKAIEYLEANCLHTRRGKGGTERENVGLVAAGFLHGSSRANDPQLHTHVVVMNWCVREDGSVGTILSRPFYEEKMTAGALYRAELARQLEQRLGMQIVREQSWFEVEGVSRPLMEEFSKRRQEITAALEAAGYSGAKAAEVANLDTRGGKSFVPRADQLAEWQTTGERYGFGREQVAALCGRATTHDREAEARRAVEAAMAEVTRQQSYFTRSELIRFIAQEVQGHGLGGDDAIAAADRVLSESPEVVRLGIWKEKERFTTKEVLDLERAMMDRVERSKSDSSHRLTAATVEREIARRETITAEQAEALRHITLRPGSVQVVSGMAGTGKTFLLDTARECWERDGYRVLGAALSGKAAKGLEDGTGIESRTCAKFLMDLQPGELTPETFAGKGFRSAAAKQKYAEKVLQPNLRIDSRTVVVVDEAGMLHTRLMEEVVGEVLSAGGKVVLVGDARQLQPIEAGGPFRTIGEAVGHAELTQIIRQREGWSRESVKAFSRGDATEALRAYTERGLVHVADDRLGAMRELIARWKEKALADPSDSLIFAGEKREVSGLNRMAQEERSKAGLLGSEEVRVGADAFHAGDRVLFTRNSRAFGLRNGDLGTVVEVRPEREEVAVRLDGDNVVVVPLGDYDHLKLGYAITTHKGQGVTCESAFVLAGGGMQDRHLTYVQASRARGETRLFIDKPQAGAELTLIARRMEQERFKLMASELLRQSVLLHQQQHQPTEQHHTHER